MTRSYWDRLKADFAALPAARQEAYHEQSRFTYMRARVDRMASTATAASSSVGASNTGAVVSLATRPLQWRADSTDLKFAEPGAMASANLMSPVSLPQSFEPLGATSDHGAASPTTSLGLQQAADDLVEAYEDNNEQAILDGLIREEALAAYLRQRPVKQTAMRFQNSTRQIGRASGATRFPDEVQYPSKCRVVCRSDSEAHVVAMCVLRMLQVTAKTCGHPNMIASADMVVMAEASFGTITHRTFWWLLAGSSQSGHHVSTQTFWRLRDMRGAMPPPDDCNGLVLAVEQRPLVKVDPPGPGPFHKQHAAPAFYSEEDVAKAVVLGEGCNKPGGGARSAKEVVIKKLNFTETMDGSLSVAGIDSAFQPLSALETAKQHRQRQTASRPAGPELGARVPDFMRLLEDEVSRPTTRRPKAKAKASMPPTTSSWGALGDDWAKTLGMDAGIVEEDSWADPSIMDGLCAALGLDAMGVLSDVQRELEEADAATPGHVAQVAGEPTGAGGLEGEDDEGASGNVVPPHGGDGHAGADLGRSVFGMRVVSTGFETGCVANVFVDAASSSASTQPPRHKIGVVHRVNAQGLKLTCKFHSRCVCWLTYRGRSHEDASMDLFRWLSKALPENGGLDESRHAQEASALKKSYGMRVRS